MSFRGFGFILVFERHLKGNSAAKYELKNYYKRRTTEETATFASFIESLKTVQSAVFPAIGRNSM